MLQLSFPLILASASPRRTEILTQAGVQHEVIPSPYLEPAHSDELKDPQVFAEEVALGKAMALKESHPQKIILGADTIGIIEGHVLEKPKDREDAKRMLKLMSGKTHQVLTSFAICVPDKPLHVESVITNVSFKALTEEEIEHYLDVADYADKAAAYAIQEEASLFVKHIEGEYFNVVGLPICRVAEVLKELASA